MTCSENTGSTECPLFMDGLPSDFASNSGLAAIAALLDEESEDYGNDIGEDSESSPKQNVSFKSGGGKIKSKGKATQCRRSPYAKKNEGKTSEKKSSMGEAQIFLQMW
eukprot:CAMPEP_0171378810 /NCGR_PEP_ID=MMETSP0879-20121228/24942_1 /TAXON_ID=67004 /ORGANISM="Thalassiosira weissflogii, Strain CCMP1336" /LENGTH=107 /DNA_ID=CAMNT_0011889367 /DNA_START=200 /DNA_END=520 /DNA_ORIENTATION=-